MKHLYPILVCLLFPFIGHAQANFKKGFVVNLQGDTLRGFINYQELGGKEPRSLAFKASEADKNSQEFSPATSRLVHIAGLATYQSYRGRISMDPVEFDKLLSQADTSKTAADLFLRVIHSGKHLRLLAYQDELKIRFFLQAQNSSPQELGYRVYLDPKENRVRTYKLYTGQLWLAAEKFGAASPALKHQLTTTQYRASDLEAIVGQINGLDAKTLKATKEKRGGLRYFAGAGMTRNVYTVTGKHELASNTTYGASYRPKLSAGADIFLNARVQRFFFRGQVSLQAAEADIFMKKDGFLVTEGHLTFKQKTISVLPQAIYNLYNTPALQFNAGIGIGLNFSTYADDIYRVKSYVRSDGTISSGENRRNEFDLQSQWFSLPLRAGLILARRLDVSLFHFMPVPIASGIGFLNYTGTHLEVNYLFGKGR